MTLNISEVEMVYLTELLENSFKETMREENRTDTLSMKHELKDRIRLIDGLRSKLTNLGQGGNELEDNRLYRVRTI
jgi:hypothetical protein